VTGRTLVIAAVLAIAVGGAFSTYVLFRDRTPATPQSATASRPTRESNAPRSSENAATAKPEVTAPAPRTPRRSTSPTPSTPSPAPVERAVELGSLRVTADVPDAQVFLDRQFIGQAPVTADNVKPGTHTLNLSAEGFDGIAQTIDVEPGPRELTFRFREVRLDSTVAVVHKHRMGSCNGQLVATPQGIRYETDDKDDRFTVPLADLEQFAVDYLDKNLKIKLRKGKQFNFTDPDGNADRLFVFQRDVEKARQRLAKGDAGATN
jgi:PEGA domain-containing protein